MSENQNKDLVGMIRKAGTQQRTLEFKCPYISDFFVKITFASKMLLSQFRETCVEVSYDTRSKSREEKINEDKLRKEYARVIIKGWRGLTSKNLAKIIPTVEYSKEDANRNIPYTKEVAVAMLEVSLEFENWITVMATEVSNFTSVEEKKKEEFENLES